MKPAPRGRSSAAGKENASANVHEPSAPTNIHLLATTLRQLRQLAESQDDKASILNSSAHPNLLPTLRSAATAPSLRPTLASLLALLSTHNAAAAILSEPPFLPLLDILLTPPADPAALTHAARATRNLTAHSPNNATSLARNSSIVRSLVHHLKHLPDTRSGPDTDPPSPEVAAALANVARAGRHCQAYAIKHAAIPALADAAMASHALTRFHAVRALSEYSLHPKWLVLLTAEGCVPNMIRLLQTDRDPDTLTEAVRFLGNLATSRVGREIVLGVAALPVLLSRLRNLPSRWTLLQTDMLRAATNLCVDTPSAARILVANDGLPVFLDSHASDVTDVRNESFRGLLIIAQAGQECRASVLREVGIRLRADAARGLCVAHLYDLSRRIKVEASASQADDFPQTIAALGTASKNYLFRAGPLAAPPEPERRPSAQRSPSKPTRPVPSRAVERDRSHPADTANSVPDLSVRPPPFRRSARLLSVQRPIRHRERLERERRGRPPVTPTSPSAAQGINTPPPQARPRPTPLSPVTRPAPSPSPDRPSPSRTRHPVAHPVDPSRLSDRGPQRHPSNVKRDDSRAMSEGHPREFDEIPTCKIIKAESDDDSAGNWVKAVWSAVCNAVSRPPPGTSPHHGAQSSTSSSLTDTFGSPIRRPSEYGTDNESEEDVYELGVPLGRGGFATVFLAKNLRTGDLVAVKRFHPPSATAPDARKKAELSLRRAMKEQRIWDGLEHKNIVSYKGCFFGQDGELNMVAEYIPGWSLADHLSQISKFPEHMVACITLQIVAGLEYLHECGVTHRDVKPANILVNPDGVIKITDFGVSSAVDVPTMTGNTLVGTPWYIAPEMIEGRPYGKSVDIWSLGCTVLELATGKRPYHHLRPHIAMFRMTQDRMPPMPKKLSPKLRDFLRICWVWDPAQRPTPAHLRRHPFLASLSRPEITNLKNMTRKV